MILKRSVKVKMPSLKRCRMDESSSFADEESVLVSAKKMRRDAYDAAGVSGLSVEDGAATRVIRNLRERIHALPPRLVDSVPISSRTSEMDSLKFTETEVSASVALKLERQSPNFQLVYERRKVRKGSSGPARENTLSKVDRADSDGLVDVDISYDTTFSYFSRTSHYVISTSVVADIEINECLGSSDLLGYGSRGKEYVDEQKESGVLLEGGKDSCKLSTFLIGDIVWAKSGSSYPAWPAIVINPLTDAPDVVFKCCIADALCVMYFGFSKNKKQREYAWVKRGMIYPFVENKQRFEGQTQMFNCRPYDFQMAIKEAVLAENCPLNANSGIFPVTCSRGLEEAVTLSSDQDSQSQVLDVHKKDMCQCDGCGLTLPFSRSSNGSISQVQSLCKPCSKLQKSKQHCRICRKTWNPCNGGSWEFENGMYHCPSCRSCSSSKLSQLVKEKQKVMMNSREKNVPPERLAVVCNGTDGIYFPYLHLVDCKCGRCRTRRITLNEWERHTGCKAKKWKYSVKVKDTMSPLGKWLAEYDALCPDPSKLTSKLISSFLQETYEPVIAKWTVERCAVCRWAEDSDENKIIICNRCQIAVHQECYGARNIDITSWVCRVCETPDVQRECCLCPVRGGALKPTDINTLWVHVTCAWFRPEVAFLDEEMEPAVGILRIPPVSFVKACVICEQTHGSCIHCCKCATYFHVVCAARAGYYMELQCHEKNGVPVSQKVTYCATHRAPKPENALVIHTRAGMYSATNVIQTQDKQQNIKGSRKILIRKKESTKLLSSKLEEFESDSAAKCRIYRRSNNKKAGIEAVVHQPMGPRHHSLSDIESLNSSRLGNPNTFPSFKERLHHLQRTENFRIGFGKSGIHGWGLFARQDIQEGEMIFEYRGELLRSIMSDRREGQYRVEGKDCYFFKISKDEVIDATNKGSMGRLINHSCMPNCFARIINVRQEESTIVIIAKTNLAAGVELTYDYMFDPAEKEDQRVPCLCKAPNCRKFMN